MRCKHVGGGVFQGLIGQGSKAPVGALEAFVLGQLQADDLLGDIAETQLLQPEKPCPDGGIVEIDDGEAPFPVQRTDVVISTVEDLLDGRVMENAAEEFGSIDGKGVDQVAAGVGGHLDEADAFGVAEEAVGLGVDADKGAAKYVVGDALQGVGVCDVLNLGPGWHA